MRRLGLGLIVACLLAGQAAAEESAAEAIRAFGLVGTWSVDCLKLPMQACDKTGCGARTIYVVPPSGPPTITNMIGTPDPAHGIIFYSTIHSATRIADDKIKIMSMQETPSGTTVVWWRQPGEVWETVLLKVGDKFRTFSAHRDDGKKISAEEGFEVRPPPPPGKMYDTLPTNWVRMEKETPLFEKCSD
jgi:hypothetical protein